MRTRYSDTPGILYIRDKDGHLLWIIEKDDMYSVCHGSSLKTHRLEPLTLACDLTFQQAQKLIDAIVEDEGPVSLQAHPVMIVETGEIFPTVNALIRKKSMSEKQAYRSLSRSVPLPDGSHIRYLARPMEPEPPVQSRQSAEWPVVAPAIEMGDPWIEYDGSRYRVMIDGRSPRMLAEAPSKKEAYAIAGALIQYKDARRYGKSIEF